MRSAVNLPCVGVASLRDDGRDAMTSTRGEGNRAAAVTPHAEAKPPSGPDSSTCSPSTMTRYSPRTSPMTLSC
jgi:hypothetical protein